jgi:2Fe-2S ferredoxin
MLELKGRHIQKTIHPQIGRTILQQAVDNGIDWGFQCTRGICARCRCLVNEGMDCLSEPNDAEWDRLEPEELDSGYRLGCQTVVEREGAVKVSHRPYFW